MSLGGPSKTIVVEPLRTSREAPAPAREPAPPRPAPLPREPAPA